MSEAAARGDLAALCRLVAHFGMDDLEGAEVTARLPDGGCLTNPERVRLAWVQPGDLVPAGDRHAALHAARPDLAWIVRTRSVAGMAVSARPEGLLPISQHALMFYGHLAVGETEAELGTHSAMLLRQQGLLAGGVDAAHAFNRIYFLERSCQAQVQAQAGGAGLVIPSEAVRVHTARQSNPEEPAGYVQLAWRAAVRLVG